MCRARVVELLLSPKRSRHTRDVWTPLETGLLPPHPNSRRADLPGGSTRAALADQSASEARQKLASWVRWRDPGGFRFSRAALWFLFFTGVAGWWAVYYTRESDVVFDGAIGDRTQFEITVLGKVLEVASVTAQSPEQLLDLTEPMGRRFTWSNLNRMWNEPGDDSVREEDVFPTHARLEWGVPEWMFYDMPAYLPQHALLVRVPLGWASAAAVLLSAVPWALGYWRRQRRALRGRCPGCGYQLAELRAVRCSECGGWHCVAVGYVTDAHCPGTVAPLPPEDVIRRAGE